MGVLMFIAGSAPANAASKRGSSTATVTGARPGEVLWTDYHLFDDDDTADFGDTIIRLINPNGGANTGITGVNEQPVCAMMYVFDDDEEMEACCGCPISSAGLLSFSILDNLVGRDAIITDDGDIGDGAVAVVAAVPNANITTLGSPSNGQGCTISQGGVCNFGCDPTNGPGYTVTTASNLLGSRIISYPPGNSLGPPGLTEIAMHDDGAGDPANLIYLQNECGQLVGNGSGAGICSCPVPGEAESPTF